MRPLLRLAALCALVGAAGPASAQLVPLAEGGARTLALGRAGTALSGDVWGHHNPASQAGLPGRAAGAFASQAFGLSELRVGAVAFAEPTAFGTFTGTARTYGFEDFRETHFGIGYARAFPVSASRSVHAGLALGYTAVSITEFGSGGALGLSLGALVEVLPGLDFGFHAYNLNRPELTEFDPLRSGLEVGLAYQAVKQALLLFSVDKDVDFPVSFRGGLEVQPVDVLFLRAGFSTEPVRFSTGVGVAVGILRADVAAERHDVLGWTPAFGFGVQF
ncbi:MAG: hypothetical protein ABJF88_16225 [Rhodothermales bacterium]